MIEWGVFALIGVVTGIFSGLLGLGGGLIVVPALLLVFNWQNLAAEHIMHLAVGTSLMTITVTSLASAYGHSKQQNINWSLVKGLVIGLVLGAITGAYIATMVSGRLLQQCFAVYALLVAVRLWLPSLPRVKWTMLSRRNLFGFANIVGIVSALVGIGGGTLLVPYLIMAKEPMHRAVGTSSACGFPISLAAVFGFIIFATDHADLNTQWQTGFVHWQAFLGIILTSSFFAYIAAKWVKQLPVILLKRLFSVVLVFISLSLLS